MYLETHPSAFHALQFLFIRIYEHVFQFPEVGDAFHALGREVLLAHPGQADINKDSSFVDMIQTILLHGQEQGDVPLEKLTRYVTILYVSLVPELLKKNTSPEYPLEIESLLAFLRSSLC